MTLMVEASHLDERILNEFPIETPGISASSRRQLIIRDRTGRVLVIYPATILRLIIRGRDLEDLSDEDADYEPFAKKARGNFKGGKMTERDKRFGYGDDFWDWWHRVGKKEIGVDIASKKEADHWYGIYKGSQFMMKNSIFYLYIPLLTYREQRIAKALLSKFALEVYVHPL